MADAIPLTTLDKIYIKFKELKEQAARDCRYDKSQPDMGYDNTNKLMDWINKKSEWNKVFREYERQRKEAYRKAFEYYQTDYPLKLNSKEEYQIFIESDDSYVEIFTRCQVVKEILVYIDSVIENLKARAWEVKGHLAWLQFSNGLS